LGLVRDWEYYYQNDVLTGPHAFTGQGIDITRLERADRRPSGLNMGLLGEPGDTLYEQAKATIPRTVLPQSLRVGPAGNNVLFSIPQGILKLDSPSIRHEGEANESHMRLIGRPKIVPGNSNTPTNVTATTPQTSAYLIAA
jgi:hypothetical protein